jgi:hypothetical protein
VAGSRSGGSTASQEKPKQRGKIRASEKSKKVNIEVREPSFSASWQDECERQWGVLVYVSAAARWEGFQWYMASI